eukprot:3478497-Prymnesium_polylepis.1
MPPRLASRAEPLWLCLMGSILVGGVATVYVETSDATAARAVEARVAAVQPRFRASQTWITSANAKKQAARFGAKSTVV